MAIAWAGFFPGSSDPRPLTGQAGAPEDRAVGRSRPPPEEPAGLGSTGPGAMGASHPHSCLGVPLLGVYKPKYERMCPGTQGCSGVGPGGQKQADFPTLPEISQTGHMGSGTEPCSGPTWQPLRPPRLISSPASPREAGSDPALLSHLRSCSRPQPVRTLPTYLTPVARFPAGILGRQQVCRAPQLSWAGAQRLHPRGSAVLGWRGRQHGAWRHRRTGGQGARGPRLAWGPWGWGGHLRCVPSAR